MRLKTYLSILSLAFLGYATSFTPSVQAVQYTGVNLSGAEFGQTKLPGTYGTDYIYPNQNEVNYFHGEGMNIVRLPFLWERLQQSLNSSLNSTEQGRLTGFVTSANNAGMYVLLDPHNFARYNGNVIGTASVPNTAFSNFW